MKRIYRAGVVGAGSGGKLSLKGLADSARYELVAVSDIHAEAAQRAAALYPWIRTYSDHRAMLAECALDVVCVATWPPSHRAIAEDALRAGLRGILVEKPLGDTWQNGRAVIDAVRAAQIPMVVPHGLLVADHGRAILDLMTKGAIGRLKLVEIECAGWDIINAGIHWLNFVVNLLPDDPFQTVMSACDVSSRTFRDGMQVETEAVTYAYTQSGVRVVMHTGDFVPVAEPGQGILFRLVGSLGLLEFFGWKSAYRLVNAPHPQGIDLEVAVGPGSNHQRYLERLAEAMDSGVCDYAAAERSLQALELCEAAYLAARHGCAVRLPLAQFVPPEPATWQPGLPYIGGGGRDGRRLDEVAR
jgi:predicted dehydrogenase